MAEADQKKLQKLVRELGRLIRAEADQGVPANKPKSKAQPRAGAPTWTSAYLDARWFADAEGYTAKLRVVLPSGSLYSLRTTDDMSALLKKLWRVRKEDSGADWYGLKVTVGPDGVVETALNNDPNCVVDPTWFHS